MKLLIFSSPRTGSILLQWALSIKHNLTPVQLHFRPTINLLVKNNQLDKTRLLEHIKTEISNSQNLDNTVTKLEAGNITLFPYSYELIPLNLFNLTHYDRVIFIDRKNKVDRLCSRIIANVFKKWHYDSQNLPLDDINPIRFNLADHEKFLCMHLLDDICMQLIEHYCRKNSIPSEFYIYENLIPWINSTVKEQSFTLPTNYQYNKIFINYSEIDTYISKHASIVRSKFLEENPQFSYLN